MGLFINNLKKKKMFMEVEVDGEEKQDPNQTSTDYTDDETGTRNPNEDQTNDTVIDQTDNPEEGNQADDNNQQNDTTDYTQMGQGSQDDEGEQGGQGTPPPNQPPVSEIDELKQKEEEMYRNLTPEQLDIKHKELKSQFLTMYDLATSISERINDAKVNDNSIKVIKYISEQLARFKDMVTDYVNQVYRTKSFIENSINYNKFMAVLNGINKILEELNDNE